jgi:hypothetical protein
MRYYVCNGMGESEDMPSERTLREFLDELDPDDEEHGAVWVSDEFENSLEFSGDGTLTLSNPSAPADRHLAGVPEERVLELWGLLIAGRLDELEKLPWAPGARPPLSPEDRARREGEQAAWQLESDRKFYELLGAEHSDEPCRRDGCRRNRIAHSVLCRVHHFESLRGRRCPFDH